MQQEQAVEGYRLSPQQRHVWQLQQESRACRAQCAVRIEGRLDRDALLAALRAVVKRHEILRTTFLRQPGRRFPLQVIAGSGSPAWHEAKLDGFDHAARQTQLESLYEDEKHRAFDLQQGPLLRATLIEQATGEHVLLLSLPALCADAWTLKNLVQEIGGFYAASLRRGFDEAFNEEADEVAQYVQFSEWQHELLEEDDDEPARNHWREHDLASAATLKLPADSGVPSAAFELDSYAFTFEAEVAAKACALAAKQGTSVGTLMLACWSALLWRLTRQTEMIIGLTVDGRKYPELHEACGLFAKVVPLKLQVEDAPFRQLLRQTAERWRAAYAFQEYFTWETATGAGASGQSFIPVSFSYEERPAKFSAGGVSFSLLRQDTCAERFKVRLTCTRAGDALAAAIHFDPQHLPASEIERLAGQFDTLLKAALANPSSDIGEPDILCAEERRRLLFDFNRTRASFRRDECLHALFEAQVERSPEATAVIFQRQRKSYRDLNAEANRLAHYLRKNGVGPDVRVGLCVERSAEAIVGLLGILKAGGAYVPLDAEHPQARLSHQLEEIDAPVLITQHKLLESLPPFKGTVICLDSDAAHLADEPDGNPVSHTTPQNLAYVIYTSGSTGTPKGVAISHRNLLNYTDFICAQLGLDDAAPGARLNFATVSTISADLGNTCIFPALVSGGCLHVLDYDTATDAGAFARYVAAHAIDVLKIVPSHLQQLLLTDEGGRILPRQFLITGGESLSLELARRIYALAADCRLLNHYGPTETTIGSVVNFDVPEALAAGVAPADGERHSTAPRMNSVPIGRGIANTFLYLLDEQFRPVPQGVAGELYIGGEGVGRGYLRQGGLTAERFLPDPFSADVGQRMYRTGDLARYLPDGQLEFLGRRDAQVKVRGFRIELGEIESVLLQHASVRQATVLVQSGEAGQARLVAYVVSERGQAHRAGGNGTGRTVSELQEHVRARVPDYMMPAAFILLDELPLTPNGKVDRRALALIDATPAPAHTHVAARTPVEQTLIEIWQQVLGVKQVGVHDNFFELGGDSILSIQIMARATQAGLRLTPRQLFEHPTVAQLAEVAGTTHAVEAEQGAVTGSVPLTPIQRSFFAHHGEYPRHWNMALLLEVRERGYTAQALRAAMTAILTHHDALRLRFTCDGDRWQQSNAASETNEFFSTVDLSTLSATERAAAIEEHAAQLQASLDLSEGPLLRVCYYEPGAGEAARLLLIIHHLAVDGVSWRILLEDLETASGQLAAGEQVSLPAKTTSYKEWAERVAEYAHSAAVTGQQAYWQRVVERARQVKPLPVDREGGEGGENLASTARTVNVEMSREETEALLSEVPRVYRTEINDVLLTALVEAIGGWTGERRMVVEMEGHGREEIAENVDVTRTVGWFTTHYPVVVEVEEGAGVGEALKAVKEELRRVPERGLGWGLLRWLRAESATGVEGAEGLGVISGEQEGAQISFNYLGQFDQVLETASAFRLASESAGTPHDPRGRRERLLDITGSILGGRLQMNWHYSEEVHRRETIETLARNYIEALQSIIAHCRSTSAGGYTPSDFPDAKLSQQELDLIAARTAIADESRSDMRSANLEDLYPLSPLQEGMLFQGLYAPAAVGIYLRQVSSTLHGSVNVAALEQAWQRVIDRHAILRTSFSWNEAEKVLQLVHRRVRLPLEQQDWRGLSTAEQETRLDAFLLADRARGFDLDVPPLMRLTLIQTAPDAFQFIWTYHHLLLDGWARSLVHKEVLTLYDALCRGESVQLEKARPYRDYIRWLEQQNLSQAERFWRTTLKGFHVATPLGDGRTSSVESGGAAGFGQQHAYLSEEATAALQSVTRKQGLTLNTLVEGAWALLLSRYSGEEDILFGITISGRPASLPQVEAIVGPFINTLPLRVRVAPDDLLQAWLKRLQAQVVELHQYDYSPLMQVQRWSEIPRGQPLFESTFVLANYPLHTPARGETGDLDFGAMKFLASQPYPLAVAAMPGDKLSLSVGYDRQRFDALLIAQMLEDWRRTLEAIVERVADPAQKLLDLPGDAVQTPDNSTRDSLPPHSPDDMETQFLF